MSESLLTNGPHLLDDPRFFVADWLDRSGIHANDRGGLTDPNRRSVEDIFDTLFLDYRSMLKSYNSGEKQKVASQRHTLIGITSVEMERALREHLTTAKAHFRQKLVDSLKSGSENLEPLKTWVLAVTGKDDDKLVGLMAHWISGVKRKMLHLPTLDHILPVLVGPQQGSGKSTAVAKLIGPVEAYRMTKPLSKLGDERDYPDFEDNYINVLDELSGAARAEMETIKTMITTEWLTYHKMQKNRSGKVRNCVSYIGTSNHNLNEKLFDQGMRRFYQFDCLNQLDWSAINGIDYKELWTGVDEKKINEYILPFKEQITVDQSQLTAADDVSLFIEESRFIPQSDETKIVTSAEVYDSYKIWALTNGHRQLSHTTLGQRLSNRGFKSAPRRHNGQKKNVYEANTECILFGPNQKLDSILYPVKKV